MDKVILFGAGQTGREALKALGSEKVLCFCDNDEKKIATEIDGKEVISYEEMKKMYQKGYKIVVTLFNNSEVVARLEADNIMDYEEYISSEDRYIKKRKYIYGKEAQQHDAYLDQYVQRARKIDFLDGVEELRLLVAEVMEKYRKENFVLAHFRYGESGFYGNLNVLLDFAGVGQDDLEPAFFPIVSHQDSITECSYVKYLYNTATIFPGNRYKNLIHDRKPWIPIFSVGPYILYAESIYSTQKITDLKKKYGRIASVYLLHTCEGENSDGMQKKLLDQIYEVYSKQYDTLFLSVYWAEIEDELYVYAQKKGFHIVSAGFRFDSEFDRRLRAIFEMSDLIITDSYATPLTCALALHKPIAFTGGRTGVHQIDFTSQGEMRELLYSEKYFEQQQYYNKIFNNTTKDYLRCMDQLEDYLGLRNVKSSDEMKAIFEISNLIWEAADGDLVWYCEGVKKTLKRLEEDNDVLRAKLLKEAVAL